jgi:hypothetical protein
MNKNIQCETILVCEKAAVDSKTNLLSIQNLTNSITVTVRPEEIEHIGTTPKLIRMPMSVAVCWKQDIGTETAIPFDITLSLKDTAGIKMLVDVPATVQIPKDAVKYYTLYNFPEGFPCTKPGMYTFEIATSHQNDENSILYSSVFHIRMIKANGEEIIVE